MAEEIVNRIAESGLITLDLEQFIPEDQNIAVFDLKDYLFMGMILKEKDFRSALTEHDWDQYQDKYLAVHCSADAIIPMWAYMLIASYAQPFAKEIIFGSTNELKNQILVRNITALNVNDYDQKRVVVKGCGDFPIAESAYLEITKKLRPHVKSLMFGEPCSTVPIYKKAKV